MPPSIAFALFMVIIPLLVTGCDGSKNQGAPNTGPSASPGASVNPTVTTRPVPAWPLPSVPEGVQGLSLFGEPLRPPVLDPATKADREGKLAAAEAAYREAPRDLEAIIWYGRRMAYLGQYRNAIAVFTQGLEFYPNSPELYRHRGHRYITLRQFGAAIRDLERAAQAMQGLPVQIEPDGLPNAKGIPLSSLQFNVWYHLGLAHYLSGSYEKAMACYDQCLEFSTNPDLLVATTDWLYLTLRHLGRDGAAEEVLNPVTEDLEIIENEGYLDLVLLYRGQRTEADVLGRDGDDLRNATVAYGVASWNRAEGRVEKGRKQLEKILAGGQWAAFGAIAAEVDLKREEAEPK